MQKINGQLKYYKWLILLLFFVMAYYMSWTETDFYFLLATGREFWNGFPHEEFLSMHEGLHYVSQQWLSSICSTRSLAWLAAMSWWGCCGEPRIRRSIC